MTTTILMPVDTRKARNADRVVPTCLPTPFVETLSVTTVVATATAAVIEEGPYSNAIFVARPPASIPIAWFVPIFD